MSETGGSSIDHSSEEQGLNSSEAKPSFTHASPEQKVWYFAKDGETFGPFTRTDLSQKFEHGEAREDCYVWRESFAEWKPAHSTSPFAEAILARKHSLKAPKIPKIPKIPKPKPKPKPKLKLKPLGVQSAALNVGRDQANKAPLISFQDPDSPADLSEPPDDSLTLDTQVKESPHPATLSSQDRASVLRSQDSLDGIDLDIDGVSTLLNTDALLAAARAQRVSGLEASKEPAFNVDLDVDGASSLIDLNSLLAVERELSVHSGELDSLDEEIDLDIDGASRVVNVMDLLASASSGSNRSQEEMLQALQGMEADFEDDTEAGGGEQSMLIQIDNLRQEQRQGKVRVLKVILTAIIAFLIIVGIVAIFSTTSKGPVSTNLYQTRTDTTADNLSDNELMALAPESDFELVYDDGDDSSEGSSEDGEGVDLVEEGAATSQTDPSTKKKKDRRVAKDGGSKKSSRPKDRHKRSGSKSSSDDRTSEPSVSLKGDPLAALKSANGGSKVELGTLDNVGKRKGIAMMGGGSGGQDPKIKSGSPRKSGPTSAGVLPGMGSGRRGKANTNSKGGGSSVGKGPRGKKSGISMKLRQKLRPGITKISKSVYRCSRRFEHKGSGTLPEGIHLRLKVEPSGKISKLKLETANLPSSFKSCLKKERSSWKFPKLGTENSIQFKQKFLVSR